jgi:hypothetical protein
LKCTVVAISDPTTMLSAEYSADNDKSCIK